MSSVCDKSSVLAIIYLVKYTLNLLRIIVPVVLIFMVSIDLIKLVINPDQSKVVKIRNVIAKRFLIAVVVFFVPMIVSLILNLLDGVLNNRAFSDFQSCVYNANANVIRTKKENEKRAKDLKIKEEERLRQATIEYEKTLENIRENQREINRIKAEQLRIEERQRKIEEEKKRIEEEKKRQAAEANNNPNYQPSYSPSNTFQTNECVGDECYNKTIVFDPNDITKISNLTGPQLTKILNNHHAKARNVAPSAGALIAAERKYQVNAIALIAIQAFESGWYESQLARECNNLGGVCGQGDVPCSVSNYVCQFRGFRSKDDFIDYHASLLRNSYLNPNGPYHEGVSLTAISLHYAGDTDDRPYWVSQLIAVGNELIAVGKKVLS